MRRSTAFVAPATVAHEPPVGKNPRPSRRAPSLGKFASSGRASPSCVERLEARAMFSTVPNDPYYAEQWGLDAIDAAEAWDSGTGSTSAMPIVAGIDTGVDYTHADLYKNIWINQAEIPAAVRKKLTDVDRDQRITFWDLNDPANAGKVGASDSNANGYIDAGDLLQPYRADGTGGWEDGRNGKNGAKDVYTDDIVGWDFGANDNDPYDYNGHGTHTAGTIAAIGNNGVGVSGVVWRSRLMAIKVFDDAGESASTSAIAAGIRYAADNGARVSNNSYGGAGGRVGDALYNAIAYAGTKGHLLVFAAGNDGVDNDYSRYASFPASYDLSNVISVSATDAGGYLAYYSNYGATSVDLSAPGSNVLSTWTGGGYRSVSGTSMAAPHVTGAVALMVSQSANLTNAQITSRLVAGADDSYALAGTSVSGGRLSAYHAVTATAGTSITGGSTTTPPVYATGPGWFWYSFPSSGGQPANGSVYRDYTGRFLG